MIVGRAYREASGKYIRAWGPSQEVDDLQQAPRVCQDDEKQIQNPFDIYNSGNPIPEFVIEENELPKTLDLRPFVYISHGHSLWQKDVTLNSFWGSKPLESHLTSLFQRQNNSIQVQRTGKELPLTNFFVQIYTNDCIFIPNKMTYGLPPAEESFLPPVLVPFNLKIYNCKNKVPVRVGDQNRTAAVVISNN